MTPPATQGRTRLRIGGFVVGVLAALALLITSLDREGGVFARRYTLYADFNDVAGLFVNAPVRLSGYSVGRVREIRFLPLGAPRAVRVELDLERSVSRLIRGDSRASVYAAGLLADMYVDVARGTEAAEPVPDGGSLPTEEPIAFAQLQISAARALGETAELAADARRIAERFGEAVDVDTVAGTIRSLASLVQQIERGDGALHQLIYTDVSDETKDIGKLLGELRRTVTRADQILAQVQGGQGMAHELVYGEGGDARQALSAITASATRLDHLLRKIEEGEGSLGALINDPSVYENLKLLLGGARESALLRSLIRLAQ